jgi:hypothetical protein
VIEIARIAVLLAIAACVVLLPLSVVLGRTETARGGEQ